MGILSIASGAAAATSSSASAARSPDSVILLRSGSCSASWLTGSAGGASRPQHQHHPELLRAPYSPTTTRKNKRKAAAESWKAHPAQQQPALQPPHRGQSALTLSSSHVIVATSTPQQWLVVGGPSHGRPTGCRTRTSLLFVVVAGGVAFLQLAYHVNYLVERYALEYSFRTATTATSSSPDHWGGSLANQFDSPAIKPLLDAPRIAGSAGEAGGGGNLRSTKNHVLEIKLTTTTTTTTRAASPTGTTHGDHADEKSIVMSNPNSLAEVPNALPVTTTTTVTTRQLNVAAAATSPSTVTEAAEMSSGDMGRREDAPNNLPPLSPEMTVKEVPSKARIRDETAILGAASSATLLSSSLLTSRPYEVLVVVPGLGEASRVPNVERSLLALRASLAKGGYRCGCHVYVWNEAVLHMSRDRLSPLQCDVHLSQGMWTHHMSRVPSVFPTNYTHVGVLLDDVDVSAVQLVDFLQLMDWSNFGVASPAFDDPIYSSMHVRYNCFFHRTDFLNIFFAVFTSEVWACWQASLIDTESNPLGWGMDATLHRVCNASLGVIDAYTGVHRETTTSYSQTEARNQMYQFISNHAATGNPKRYLECAGHERPAAFEECQLYWDGTEAKSTVDWQC